MSIDDTYLCPVCGYEGLTEPPWSDDSPSDEICPSCGTHFGYDDAAGGSAARRGAVHRMLRRQWVDAGCSWFSSSTRSPTGWDPLAQLELFGELEQQERSPLIDGAITDGDRPHAEDE